MAETNVITFRLTVDALARLDELVALHGSSRGETARALMVQALFHNPETIAQELLRLNNNLRLATAAILADGGRAEVAEAEEFVRKYFS
jgi:hypothetical protein